MARIGKLMEGDYFILPSSRHEVLIVSADFGLSPRELSEMVYMVNREAVSSSDYLSDKIQFYSVAENKWTNAENCGFEVMHERRN